MPKNNLADAGPDKSSVWQGSQHDTWTTVTRFDECDFFVRSAWKSTNTKLLFWVLIDWWLARLSSSFHDWYANTLSSTSPQKFIDEFPNFNNRCPAAAVTTKNVNFSTNLAVLLGRPRELLICLLPLTSVHFHFCIECLLFAYWLFNWISICQHEANSFTSHLELSASAHNFQVRRFIAKCVSVLFCNKK